MIIGLVVDKIIVVDRNIWSDPASGSNLTPTSVGSSTLVWASDVGVDIETPIIIKEG